MGQPITHANKMARLFEMWPFLSGTTANLPGASQAAGVLDVSISFKLHSLSLFYVFVSLFVLACSWIKFCLFPLGNITSHTNSVLEIGSISSVVQYDMLVNSVIASCYHQFMFLTSPLFLLSFALPCFYLYFLTR